MEAMERVREDNDNKGEMTATRSPSMSLNSTPRFISSQKRKNLMQRRIEMRKRNEERQRQIQEQRGSSQLQQQTEKQNLQQRQIQFDNQGDFAIESDGSYQQKHSYPQHQNIPSYRVAEGTQQQQSLTRNRNQPLCLQQKLQQAQHINSILKKQQPLSQTRPNNLNSHSRQRSITQIPRSVLDVEPHAVSPVNCREEAFGCSLANQNHLRPRRSFARAKKHSQYSRSSSPPAVRSPPVVQRIQHTPHNGDSVSHLLPPPYDGENYALPYSSQFGRHYHRNALNQNSNGIGDEVYGNGAHRIVRGSSRNSNWPRIVSPHDSPSDESAHGYHDNRNKTGLRMGSSLSRGEEHQVRRKQSIGGQCDSQQQQPHNYLRVCKSPPHEMEPPTDADPPQLQRPHQPQQQLQFEDSQHGDQRQLTGQRFLLRKQALHKQHNYSPHNSEHQHSSREMSESLQLRCHHQNEIFFHNSNESKAQTARATQSVNNNHSRGVFKNVTPEQSGKQGEASYDPKQTSLESNQLRPTSISMKHHHYLHESYHHQGPQNDSVDEESGALSISERIKTFDDAIHGQQTHGQKQRSRSLSREKPTKWSLRTLQNSCSSAASPTGSSNRNEGVKHSVSEGFHQNPQNFAPHAVTPLDFPSLLDEETVSGSVASLKKEWEGKFNPEIQNHLKHTHPRLTAVEHDDKSGAFEVWEQRANRLAGIQRREQRKQIEQKWRRNAASSFPLDRLGCQPNGALRNCPDSKIGKHKSNIAAETPNILSTSTSIRNKADYPPDRRVYHKGYQLDDDGKVRQSNSMVQNNHDAYHDHSVNIQNEPESGNCDHGAQQGERPHKAELRLMTVEDARHRLWDQKERLRAVLPKSASFDSVNDFRKWHENSYSPGEASGSAGSALFKSKFVHAAAVAAQQRTHFDDHTKHKHRIFASSSHQHKGAAVSSHFTDSTADTTVITTPVNSNGSLHATFKGRPEEGSNLKDTHRKNDRQIQRGVSPSPAKNLVPKESFMEPSIKTEPKNGGELIHEKRDKTSLKSNNNNLEVANKNENFQRSSVAELIARINAVSRSDPAEALAAIDSIIQAETRPPIHSSQILSNTAPSPKNLLSNRELVVFPEPKAVGRPLGKDFFQEKRDNVEHDINNEKNHFEESHETSDDSTVSSMTNPTYQSVSAAKNDKANKCSPHFPLKTQLNVTRNHAWDSEGVLQDLGYYNSDPKLSTPDLVNLASQSNEQPKINFSASKHGSPQQATNDTEIIPSVGDILNVFLQSSSQTSGKGTEVVISENKNFSNSNSFVKQRIEEMNNRHSRPLSQHELKSEGEVRSERRVSSNQLFSEELAHGCDIKLNQNAPTGDIDKAWVSIPTNNFFDSKQGFAKRSKQTSKSNQDDNEMSNNPAKEFHLSEVGKTKKKYIQPQQIAKQIKSVGSVLPLKVKTPLSSASLSDTFKDYEKFQPQIKTATPKGEQSRALNAQPKKILHQKAGNGRLSALPHEISEAFSDIDISLDEAKPRENRISSLNTISKAFSNVDINIDNGSIVSQGRKRLEDLAKSCPARVLTHDKNRPISKSSYVDDVTNKEIQRFDSSDRRVEPNLRVKGNKKLAQKFANLVKAYEYDMD